MDETRVFEGGERVADVRLGTVEEGSQEWQIQEEAIRNERCGEHC